MDLKVIKRYVDRHSKKIVEVDTVLSNVENSRAEELIEQKVVKAVKKPASEKTTEAKQEG